MSIQNINTKTTSETNFVEDLVGGIFTFTGKIVGGTVGYAADAIVGTAKGVTELPGAVIDSFSNGYEIFDSDEPKEADAVTAGEQTEPVNITEKQEQSEIDILKAQNAELTKRLDELIKSLNER